MMAVLTVILAYLGCGGVAHAATMTAPEAGMPLWKVLLSLTASGAILGLGRLLASSEPLSWRLVIGRSVVSSGLAVGAGALLSFLPTLPPLAVAGFAALSAVLGEQFIEHLINKRLGGE